MKTIDEGTKELANFQMQMEVSYCIQVGFNYQSYWY